MKAATSPLIDPKGASMRKIECPNCHSVFTIDEDAYFDILRQVKDEEFSKELAKREKLLSTNQKQEIENLKLRLLQDYEANLNSLKNEVSLLKKEKELSLQNSENKTNALLSKLRLEEEKKRQELSLTYQNDLRKLENNNIKLLNEKEEAKLKLKNEYDLKLKAKDEEIAYYRDLKARASTKMIGESLERHCEDEFNKLRATAFTKAYFEKDNQISDSGSKGDYIFRDYDEEGEEIISIMFEMKNENETTATKKKNSDFLKELDKDRREKNCEYAVLVSLLEEDSELYNTGIVDVSYRYPKMYVIRPQFFIQIITLLRNAALNSLTYKKQLALEKAHNIDLENFEKNMEQFKAGFARNFELASKKFNAAIDDIDKTIKTLQKIREELVSSENNLRLANDKADKLSLKKLAKDSPSIKAQLTK